MGEKNVYDGLYVSKSESMDIEKKPTTDQSKNPFWKTIRKSRLTSSSFKRICSRKKDHESLAESLLSTNKIQTAAMKFGLDHENGAAESHASLTGNNVINPPSCHLGTSPDRKVIDPNAVPVYGLLEIKCPNSDSITNLKYFNLINNTYKLKTTHEYYHQIMGQMGITGALWCDLFIWCQNDFHLERIDFIPGKWQEMKEKLDMFYFTKFLPKCVKH